MLSFEEIKEKYDVNQEMIDFFGQMVQRTVRFSYTKVNGETREAFGTINVDLVIDENDQGYDYLKNKVFNIDEDGFSLFDDSGIDKYFHYYDIEEKGIRQFLPERFIGFEKEEAN